MARGCFFKVGSVYSVKSNSALSTSDSTSTRVIYIYTHNCRYSYITHLRTPFVLCQNTGSKIRKIFLIRKASNNFLHRGIFFSSTFFTKETLWWLKNTFKFFRLDIFLLFTHMYQVLFFCAFVEVSGTRSVRRDVGKRARETWRASDKLATNIKYINIRIKQTGRQAVPLKRSVPLYIAIPFYCPALSICHRMTSLRLCKIIRNWVHKLSWIFRKTRRRYTSNVVFFSPLHYC